MKNPVEHEPDAPPKDDLGATERVTGVIDRKSRLIRNLIVDDDVQVGGLLAGQKGGEKSEKEEVDSKSLLRLIAISPLTGDPYLPDFRRQIAAKARHVSLAQLSTVETMPKVQKVDESPASEPSLAELSDVGQMSFTKAKATLHQLLSKGPDPMASFPQLETLVSRADVAKYAAAILKETRDPSAQQLAQTHSDEGLTKPQWQTVKPKPPPLTCQLLAALGAAGNGAAQSALCEVAADKVVAEAVRDHVLPFCLCSYPARR